MSALAKLPKPTDVRITGHGKSRAIRVLYRERCSLDEIAAALNVSLALISQALRWKAGSAPLSARRVA